MRWIQHIRQSRRLQRCRQAGHPDFVCDYLEQGANHPARNTPWEAVRFVVFDTETTGLTPSRDRLLSIGAVAVEQEAIVLNDSLELLVKNEAQLEEEAVAVHGIVPTELALGVEETEAIAAFLQYLRADVVVAHHLAFDAAMIEQAVRRLGVRKFHLHNLRLDTAQLAQKLEHPGHSPEHINHRNYTLDALTERYDIARADRHTAWGDAYITAILLLKLLRMARDQNHLGLGSLVR
ncbi:MAG: 3'-5' exonuclease [Bacteroidetes bacterium]|nr:MAG: 3'-5' exonuclease [Bacteroidota bacterium]